LATKASRPIAAVAINLNLIKFTLTYPISISKLLSALPYVFSFSFLSVTIADSF
jgi:hypothetical protein